MWADTFFIRKDLKEIPHSPTKLGIVDSLNLGEIRYIVPTKHSM